MGRAAAKLAALAAAFALVAAALPAAALAGLRVIAESGIATLEDSRTDELVAHTLPDSPDIYVLDFPSLAQQGAMFNRVVAFIERVGAPHDRVLTDSELAELIRSLGRKPTTFAFGNDFRVSELVRFFNLADLGGVELNAEEALLRDFLAEQGLMRVKYQFFQTVWPDRVILSIPQVRPHGGGDGVAILPGVRASILRHELAHGEFYANDDYAEYCAAFWTQVMTEAERAAFRTFLGAKAYDTDNDDLMINETQAYLIHTPDPAAFNPARLKLSGAAIERLRQRFWAGNPPSRLYRAERSSGR